MEIKHKYLLESENCTTCGYFLSFQDEYEDELEPDNFGNCKCEDSPFRGNKGAGESEVCYCHTKFKNNLEVQFYKHSLEAWDWSNDAEDVINLESFEKIIKAEKLRWYKELGEIISSVFEEDNDSGLISIGGKIFEITPYDEDKKMAYWIYYEDGDIFYCSKCIDDRLEEVNKNKEFSDEIDYRSGQTCGYYEDYAYTEKPECCCKCGTPLYSEYDNKIKELENE